MIIYKQATSSLPLAKGFICFIEVYDWIRNFNHTIYWIKLLPNANVHRLCCLFLPLQANDFSSSSTTFFMPTANGYFSTSAAIFATLNWHYLSHFSGSVATFLNSMPIYFLSTAECWLFMAHHFVCDFSSRFLCLSTFFITKTTWIFSGSMPTFPNAPNRRQVLQGRPKNSLRLTRRLLPNKRQFFSSRLSRLNSYFSLFRAHRLYQLDGDISAATATFPLPIAILFRMYGCASLTFSLENTLKKKNRSQTTETFYVFLSKCNVGFQELTLFN